VCWPKALVALVGLVSDRLEELRRRRKSGGRG
jgi:hypothetical protein